MEEYKKDNINNLVQFIRMEAKYDSFDKNKLITEFNKTVFF